MVHKMEILKRTKGGMRKMGRSGKFAPNYSIRKLIICFGFYVYFFNGFYFGCPVV